MRTIRLTLAYDGGAYAGWQVQPGERTIQGELEKAAAKVTGQGVRVIGSGRTDAGVHALGQVAAFCTESRLAADVLRRAIDAELPDDIAVLDAAKAADGFHPIRDAVRKRYRYVLHDGPIPDVFRRRYCWHYRRRLDVEAMSRAGQALMGTHDFASFETSGAARPDSIRTVFELTAVRGQGGASDLITIEVEADGFLYNMVRTIVGTLVEIGRGAQPEAWADEVLSARDRRAAGPTAPPQGLFLLRVEYPC